jgi:hypothetical protein
MGEVKGMNSKEDAQERRNEGNFERVNANERVRACRSQGTYGLRFRVLADV